MANVQNHFLKSLLHEMSTRGASDLFLTVDVPPSLRINGTISPISMDRLSAADIEQIIQDTVEENLYRKFIETNELNMAMLGEHGERYRVNLHRQQHLPGIVIRSIKTQIPTPEELGLPEIYKNIALEKRGLVLFVGPTGAGKSTSMASMLGYRNHHGSGHVVTVEDPIEFVHANVNCIFTQREIGIDTESYHNALKNALRQSPDVVVVGEIRDKETMESAIYFAETGHLCIATLHGANTIQALERILSFFHDSVHKLVQASLAQNLKAILSQRLIPNLRGGRSLAVEILLNHGLSRRIIEEGRIKEIREFIERMRDEGMQSFDQHLLELVVKNEVSEEIGQREADNPGNFRLRLTQAKASQAGLGQVQASSSVYVKNYSEQDRKRDANWPEFDKYINKY